MAAVRKLARIAWIAVTAFAGTAAAQPAPPAVAGKRVATVKTLGTDLTAPHRLVRELGLEVGSPYDAARVQRGRTELLELGWLAQLQVLPALVTPDSLVVVVIAERASAAALHPLLHVRADDRLVLGAKLRFWGGAGRGERLSLAVAGGGEKRIEVEWSEPHPVLALTLGALFHAEVVEELEEGEDGIAFDRLALGTKLMLPPRGARLELTGSLWQVEASDPAGLVSSGRSDRLRRGAIAFAWGRLPPRFTWSYLHGRIGLAATTGAAEHQDLEAGFAAAAALGRRCVVATGLELRAVRGVVPRYERLHLGSGPSLRGHDYGVSNGDAGICGGVEMRFPINFWSPQSFARVRLPVAVHCFADVGSAWGASAPGARTEASSWRQARRRWSAGLGVTASLRPSYPLLVELGRDDAGVWRTEIRTSYSF